MQRLRILIPCLLTATICLAAPADNAKPKTPVAPVPPISAAEAQKALAAAAAKGAVQLPSTEPEKKKGLEIGQTLDVTTDFTQVWPTAGSVSLMPRKGRPLAIFFWGVNTVNAKDDLLALDEYVRSKDLLKKMDVYGVASYKSDKLKTDDVRDAAVITGIQTIPILCDPDFQLSARLSASMFPELSLLDKDGKFLVKGLRGLDHGNVSGSGGTAADLLMLLADKGTADLVPRTFPYYQSERMKGHEAPDFELPLFSVEGFGKGKLTRFSSLLSHQRPAILMFFSSTCTHCQVDVPQIVKFIEENPNRWDIIGITRIKNAQHRKVSQDYFTQMKIKFPILEDAGAVSDLYQVSSTPTTFYMSPESSIVSVSYFQHENLIGDWLKLEPRLLGAPKPLPNAKATGWKFPLKVRDDKGKEVDLATLAGKPTVLHFWATWCGPCRAELPALLARLPEMQAKANVLLVTVEDDPKAVAKYQQDVGLKFTSLLAPHGGLADKVNFSRSVPRTYVLDGSGKVVNTLVGSLDWADEDKYAQVLGRLMK